MVYDAKAVIDMLSDMKQEAINAPDKIFCACRFVQSPIALDIVNDRTFSSEYEYLSLVDVMEGDYALAISKLEAGREGCGKIGIVRVTKVYTEYRQPHPAVLSNKTGFIVEKLNFPWELKRRMEEREEYQAMRSEISARIQEVQRSLMLEELAGRDERLRELLAQFSERFPGKHLMIGGNH